MSRHRIGREGVKTSHGLLLVEGGLTWSDEPVPLLIVEESAGPGHSGARLIGTVTDVRREAEGWITADLSDPRSGYAPEMDCRGPLFDEVEVDGVRVVRRMTLMAVTLGKLPVWEGLWLP